MVLFGMPNLSITDDEGSRTSDKPNVPSNPQEIEPRTDTNPLPFATPAHDNAIDLLRHELMGKINGQSNDIRALASKVDGLTFSNAKLISTNAELKPSNARLTSSNAELKTSNPQLTSSIAELTSKVTGLTLSNADLLEKADKFAVSNSDMSSTLQRHTRTLYALHRRMVLDDARDKLATDYNFSQDELRPRYSDISPLVTQIRSRLNAEDMKLSDEALTMIFDRSKDSLRHSGNKAAHQTPVADRVDSVLETKLTNRQRTLLGEIFYFT